MAVFVTKRRGLSVRLRGDKSFAFFVNGRFETEDASAIEVLEKARGVFRLPDPPKAEAPKADPEKKEAPSQKKSKAKGAK